MLCLKNDTNPEWIAAASQRLTDIMIDHAHCEKKAAANGMSMIQRYPEKDDLVRDMIDLINEEMEHFAFVVKELHRRGASLTRDRGDRYAQLLTQHIRKQEPHKLLDLLLVDALIEARSCERFSILSKCGDIPADLREFYRSLLASEAGHYRTFTDIARRYFPAEEVRRRLDELAEIEAEIVRNLPNEPTIHG